MQTDILESYRRTDEGQEADAILRSCVHCGFCNATCPTYRLLGDELDGPRGRIYLIKQVLEGHEPTETTQQHLDRCLTCRACETTCPSGVRYGRLVDIGRGIVDAKVPRPWMERVFRTTLRKLVGHPTRLLPLMAVGRWTRPLLPRFLREKVPPRAPSVPWPEARHTRFAVTLAGCAQAVARPGIDAALARLLHERDMGLEVSTGTGCCGALSYHLGAYEEALDFMRRNVDAWWPRIQAGAETVVVSSSACAVMVREYGDRLAHDPAYAERAREVAARVRDPVELLEDSGDAMDGRLDGYRIAFHSPCTLQHGERLAGRVEALLTRAGATLTPVRDPHICCGSAGTYAFLQPKLADQLLIDKLRALEAQQPDFIATANIGCLLHLGGRAAKPIFHWLEALANPEAIHTATAHNDTDHVEPSATHATTSHPGATL